MFGFENEGAVLIKLMGSRARPDEVYKTYRHNPIVVNNPRVNVSARSPSNNRLELLDKYTYPMSSGTLTILGQQFLEVVQVLTVFVLRNRNKEADEEQYNYDCHEAYSILESTPKALQNSLFSRFGSDLVIFFVEEVGERNHEQAKDGIQGVE